MMQGKGAVISHLLRLLQHLLVVHHLVCGHYELRLGVPLVVGNVIPESKRVIRATNMLATNLEG